MHACVRARARVCVCVRTCVRSHARVCVRTCMHSRARVCVCVCAYLSACVNFVLCEYYDAKHIMFFHFKMRHYEICLLLKMQHNEIAVG